jgi:hypothetical protein
MNTTYPPQSPDRLLRKWSIAGFFAVTILGALLHFVFNWTQQNGIVGLFTPVNESIWEHLKLGYGGLVLFALIEFPFVWKYAHNYCLAKALGVVIISASVLGTFYAYSSVDDMHTILWLDMLSFVGGVALAQLVTYGLYRLRPLGKTVRLASILWLVAFTAILAFFTYYPPHTDLFLDSTNNTYGIHQQP